MDNGLQEMARDFYGFGRWDAPYWFIGPEPGGEGNESRAKAFLKLNSDGLCDCREFHKEIGVTQWHREPPESAALQPTWRRLMLLLLSALGQSTNQIALRRYQCRDWGMFSSETCVIELGGLSARNLRTSVDRKSFRDRRIEQIRGRLSVSAPRPKVVLMYGMSSKTAWKQISGCSLIPGAFERCNQTVFALMPSPASFGQKDEDWIQLGTKIAKQF